MALPTSGPLALSDIQTEFGGTNPISLSEYYAGGANVPSGTSGTNGPVPTSGTISISSFYGTSNIAPLSVSASNVSGLDEGPSGGGTVTSDTNANATASGGTPPYTYAWVHVSTSSGNTPSITGSTSQSPSWSASVLDGTPSVSTWRVTATDSVTDTATFNISVTLTWVNTS